MSMEVNTRVMRPIHAERAVLSSRRRRTYQAFEWQGVPDQFLKVAERLHRHNAEQPILLMFFVCQYS
ncbi:hypothetical protein K438DRAFT_1830954 [Mycena galopus ATCC 62051]|nr:hypothetical protein K438DRAFT_1830954 [Mycena galopus ATCC 62051]